MNPGRSGRPSLLRRGARVLWRFVRVHPSPFAIAVGGAVLYAAGAVGATVVVGAVTDRLIVPAFSTGVDRGAVVGGLVAVIGVGLLRSGSIVVRRYFGAQVTARMQRTLREEVVGTYLRAPLGFHRSSPTGELLAHADADVIGATTVLLPLPFSVGLVALVVFALGSLVVVDWTFALIAVVLFPALALLNRSYTARVEHPAAEVQRLIGDVSNVAHESIDGALTVKTLGRTDAEVERFSQVAASLRDTSIGVGEIRADYEPVIDALPNLGVLVLLVVGAWRISSGDVTVGELVQASLLFSILAAPLRVFGFFLQELPRAVVSAARLEAVAAVPAAPGAVMPMRNLPQGPLSIDVNGLRFDYGGVRVLDDVTFGVTPGETVALVGATGSGKSTLAELLIRLDEPSAGSIRLGGVSIGSVDPDELRAAVSLVFQESFLFAGTLAHNIGFGRVAADRVEAAADLAQVSRFVTELPRGWDTVVGERGVTLSGGQRQRVAIARALARSPRVLVLDDATSAIDVTVEALILEGLSALGGITVVIVAHRLSTIRLADRVVYLRDGRVDAVGSHEELLGNPGYAALVRAYERDRSWGHDADGTLR